MTEESGVIINSDMHVVHVVLISLTTGPEPRSLNESTSQKNSHPVAYTPC